MKSSLAIACQSGTFKSVFTHGVLSAFESLGIQADIYGGASSSAFIAACAAIGKSSAIGVEYWYSALKTLQEFDNNLSQVVLQGLVEYSSMICEELFLPNAQRLIIAVSAVVTPEAREQTQGNKAKRLGYQLLLAAKQKNRSWTEQNLKTELFDSAINDSTKQLSTNNFNQVVYASTRMLHAWDIPAWINNQPYIDASYTCSCPALEITQLGCQKVIAIATEPGILYTDIFETKKIPENWNNVPIYTIKPDKDLKEFGVNFASATEETLLIAYQHGEKKGKEFIDKFSSHWL